MTAALPPSAPWMRPGMAVTSFTVPWPQSNLLAFLRRAVGRRRFFWENRRARLPFAAFGAAAVLSGRGPGRFQMIRKQAEDLFSRIHRLPSSEVPPEASRPKLIGGFSFRAPNDDRAAAGRSTAGVWSPFPPYFFVLPEYSLTRVSGHSYLTVNRLCAADDEWAAHEALWNLPAPLDVPALSNQPTGMPIRDLVDQPHWHTMVGEAMAGIRSGSMEKIVLARARELPASTNPLAALARLSGRYPDCYRFLVEPAHGQAFFGATPELLASAHDDRVETMALAGSNRRGCTLEEDRALGEQLLASQKDRREHQLVVEDIIARLQPLVFDLRTRPTSLLKLSNIQHLSTLITAAMDAPVSLLELVEALHPTPAVGGTPTGLGLDFIERTEPVSRGWYAAPVGWFDSRGDGEFAVALRAAVTSADRTRLYAGAGIVDGSDPAKEWEETELKFRPMMEAVGCL